MSMITSTQALTVARKTNGRCFYCNKPAEEIDHFIPKSIWIEKELSKYGHGSVDKIENLFGSCGNCNRKKSEKHPIVFMGRHAFRRQFGIIDIFGELTYGS